MGPVRRGEGGGEGRRRGECGIGTWLKENVRKETFAGVQMKGS